MEILLNGMTLDEIQKHNSAVNKDASSYMADKVKDLVDYCKQIINSEGDVDRVSIAEKALIVASDIRKVSRFSGVEYCIEESLSNDLHDIVTGRGKIDYSEYRDSPILQLSGELGDMEYCFTQWNTSSC